MTDHSAVAEKAWGSADAVKAVLDDYRSAKLDPKLRTTLAFLEKLTLTPAEVGAADIEPMRAAGVRADAMRDAVEVAALFNVIDRLADAFDFDVATPADGPRTAFILLKLGYRGASVPGAPAE